MSELNSMFLDQQLASSATGKERVDTLKQLETQRKLLSSSLFPSTTTNPSNGTSLLSCYMHTHANQQLQEALANHQRSAAALSSAVIAAERAASIRRIVTLDNHRRRAFPGALGPTTATSTATPSLNLPLGFLPSTVATAPRSTLIYEALSDALMNAESDNALLSNSKTTHGTTLPSLLPLKTRSETICTASTSGSTTTDESMSATSNEHQIKNQDENEKKSIEDQRDNTVASVLRPTVTRDDYWDTLYKKLVEYKKKHGDCLVPSRYQEDRQLGRWVSRQRERQHFLSEECKGLLNKLGFTWNVFQRKSWESMFGLLVQYKMKHGNCLVPARYKENPRLGRWVRKQRMIQNNICEERKRMLNSIGFVWNVR